MASLSSIASGIRQSASDLAFEARVLREAEILEPMRPDKATKIGVTFIRWGASPATGIATAAPRTRSSCQAGPATATGCAVTVAGCARWRRGHRARLRPLLLVRYQSRAGNVPARWP